MKRHEAFLYGVAVAFILSATYVILDTLVHMPPERERVCRSISGKQVECP